MKSLTSSSPQENEQGASALVRNDLQSQLLTLHNVTKSTESECLDTEDPRHILEAICDVHRSLSTLTTLQSPVEQEKKAVVDWFMRNALSVLQEILLHNIDPKIYQYAQTFRELAQWYHLPYIEVETISQMETQWERFSLRQSYESALEHKEKFDDQYAIGTLRVIRNACEEKGIKL